MEFNTLVAKQALGIAEAEDFSLWAEQLLSRGCDNQNVAILAGFGLEDTPDLQEVNVYFARCVDELGLSLPEVHRAIFIYAKDLATKITTGLLKPTTGLGLLKSLWLATDCYEPLYSIWYELAVDIYSLEHEDVYLWNTGLLKDNINDFIILIAEQFLRLCECENLPENFLNLSACQQCGHVGLSQTKRTELLWLPEKVFWLLYGRNPTVEDVCEQCGAAQLKGMRDYQGRALYLLTVNAE